MVPVEMAGRGVFELLFLVMKHTPEPTPPPDQLMHEALADWMFDAIMEIGAVDEEIDPNEVVSVVLDFVWPETEEDQISSFIWMMREYRIALFSDRNEKEWNYIMASEDEYRRFIGKFVDEITHIEAA